MYRIHQTPLRKDGDRSPLQPIIDPFTGQPYSRDELTVASAIDAIHVAEDGSDTPAGLHLDPAEEIALLKQFLASADARNRKVTAEAKAAKDEAARIRTAWLNAVGGRLLWRPDLITALAETTTDMRIRLDEIDEEASGARMAEMVSEYGPFVASQVEEDA